ncbi:MAG TPA: iron-sulfur cluster repair di-iron protein, ric [Erysipelothrix sp.]|nr:iron-sulfur cluster repair di-iron protein, ric [Erysipelothrix sp.]
MNKTFNKEELIQQLQLYVPIVARVHGPSHPEFYEVQNEFVEMTKKLEQQPEATLDPHFNKLRGITNNYTVPSDVCESYEAVYYMLQQLDENR